jgi:hypothetical protein
MEIYRYMLDLRSEYYKTGALQLGTVKQVKIGSHEITIQLENSPANPQRIVALAFHKGRSLLRKEFLLKSAPQPPEIQKTLLICFQSFFRCLNEQITEGIVTFPLSEPETEQTVMAIEEQFSPASTGIDTPQHDEGPAEILKSGGELDGITAIEGEGSAQPETTIEKGSAGSNLHCPEDDRGSVPLPENHENVSPQQDEISHEQGVSQEAQGNPASARLKPETSDQDDKFNGDPHLADVFKKLHRKPNVQGMVFVSFREQSVQSIISQGECPSEQEMEAYCRKLLPALQAPQTSAYLGKAKFFLLEADGHVCLIWPQGTDALLFLYLTKYDQAFKQFLENECQTPSSSGWREGAAQ